MADVRAPTEIDQWTTAVDGSLGHGDLVANDTALELIVLHHKRRRK